MSEYMNAIVNRRSMYNLSGETTLPDEELEDKLQQLVKNLPTAYNMQSTCMAMLTGDAHKKLWNIVLETLRPKVAPEKFARTESKIGSFAAGYGTILYFNDDAASQEVKDKNPLYADTVDFWVAQHTGMLQLASWVLLEDLGLGASLQHYNPLIDDEVKRTFGLPESWRLFSQMPFGKPTAPAGEKVFRNVDERFRKIGTL